MSKRFAALCIALFLLLAALPGAAAAGPALSATTAYCIMDADTGLVLAQQIWTSACTRHPSPR